MSRSVRRLSRDGREKIRHGAQDRLIAPLGAMPFGEPAWIVEGKLGRSGLVLPNERAEGQVDAHGLGRSHQRRSGARIAEYDYLRRPQPQPGRRRGGGAIDAGKDRRPRESSPRR